MSTASDLRQIALHRPFFVGLKKKNKTVEIDWNQKKDRRKQRIFLNSVQCRFLPTLKKLGK